MTMAMTARAQDFLKRLSSFAEKNLLSLMGLIQRLDGTYTTDPPMDGTGEAIDISKQEGSYPSIASGYSLSFNGIGNGVTFTEKALLGSYDGFDIEFYLKTTDDSTNILSQYLTVGNQRSFFIALTVVGGLDVFVSSDGTFGGGLNQNFPSVNDGTWHLIRVVYDPSQTNFLVYYDGEMQSPTSTSGTMPSTGFDSTAPLELGFRQASNYLLGEIGHVLVKDLLENTLLDLRIIEGQGANVKDYSDNLNDGTILGASWVDEVPYGNQMSFDGHNVTQNLVLNSERFDLTGYSVSGISLTESLDKPFAGIEKSWELTENNSISLHRLVLSTSFGSGYFVVSLFVKQGAGVQRYLQFQGWGISGAVETCNFDLVNGVIDFGATSTIVLNADMVNVGNGWYRCIMYCNKASGTTLSIGLNDVLTFNQDASYAGNGSSSILATGYQITEGNYLWPYVGVHTAHVSGEYINLMGNSFNSQVDIENNDISIFPYDKNRFVLPENGNLVFDGVDDKVVFSTASASVLDTFTVKGRFICEDVSATQMFFSINNNASDIIVFNVVSGFFVFLVNNGANFSVRAKIENNVVYEFIAIWDLNDPRLIINGIQKDEGTSGVIFDGSVQVLGGRSSFFFKGWIDYIQIDETFRVDSSNNFEDSIGSNDGVLNGSMASKDLTVFYADNAEIYTGVALGHDGVNDYVETSNGGGLNRSTMTAIVDLRSTAMGNNYFFTRYDVNDAVEGEALTFGMTLQDGYFRVVATGDGIYNNGANTYDYRTVREDLNDGEWHQLVFTFDNGVLLLYVDGALESIIKTRDQTFTTLYDSNVNYATGVLDNGSFFSATAFEGDIDKCQIINASLTALQVEEIYGDPQLHYPTGITPSDITLDLRFNEAVGSVTYDYSPNGNNGTVNGATWIGGITFPVEQLCFTNFNLGVSDEILGEDPDSIGFDILGDPISYSRSSSVFNLPYTYHNGLTTEHRDYMEPTDGVSIGFVTEYQYVNDGDANNVIFCKGTNVTGASDYSIYADSLDFDLIVANTTIVALDYTPAKTGFHHHLVVIDAEGGVEWYVDGILRKTASTVAIPSNTGLLRWGQDELATRSYTKPMGGLAFYNRKLSSSEAVLEFDKYKSEFNL